MNKQLIEVIQDIVKATVNSSMKPVTVQTGVFNDDGTVQLDSQLPVEVTLPAPVTVSVKGNLNGYEVSGELTMEIRYDTGSFVKVLKEDGANKYNVLNQV